MLGYDALGADALGADSTSSSADSMDGAVSGIALTTPESITSGAISTTVSVGSVTLGITEAFSGSTLSAGGSANVPGMALESAGTITVGALFTGIVPSIGDLRKALLQGVVSCNLGIPLTSENMPFTRPGDDTPWAVVEAEIARSFPVTLGLGGYDQYEGMVSVVLHVKAMTGTAVLRGLESALAEGLRIGTVLQYGATKALVVGFGDIQDDSKDGLYRRHVRLLWQAQLPRPG